MKCLTNGYIRTNYAGPIHLYPDYVMNISTKFVISDWTAEALLDDVDGVHVQVVNPKALKPQFIISVDQFSGFKKHVTFGPRIQFNKKYNKAFIKLSWSRIHYYDGQTRAFKYRGDDEAICYACNNVVHPWLVYHAIDKQKGKITRIHPVVLQLDVCPPPNNIFSMEVDLRKKKVSVSYSNGTVDEGLKNADKIQFGIAFRAGCSKYEKIQILDYELLH